MVERKQIPLRVPLEDFVRCAALAAREGVSFNSWVCGAMMERAKREQVVRASVVENVPRVPSTPERVVREGAVVSAGVGRLGTVSSADLELQRVRARDLAQRSGKCTADVERGVRCRLCGKMH
jgi:hypothetical protein